MQNCWVEPQQIFIWSSLPHDYYKCSYFKADQYSYIAITTILQKSGLSMPFPWIGPLEKCFALPDIPCMTVIHNTACTYGTWVHQWLTHPAPHPTTPCTYHITLPPILLPCPPTFPLDMFAGISVYIHMYLCGSQVVPLCIRAYCMHTHL